MMFNPDDISRHETLRPSNLAVHRYSQSDFVEDTINWQTAAMVWGSVLIAVALVALWGWDKFQ
jgi:hypothetical protein